MSRDPRVDPRPGDVIEHDGIVHTIKTRQPYRLPLYGWNGYPPAPTVVPYVVAVEMHSTALRQTTWHLRVLADAWYRGIIPWPDLRGATILHTAEAP